MTCPTCNEHAPTGEIVAALVVGGAAALVGCLVTLAALLKRASVYIGEQMP